MVFSAVRPRVLRQGATMCKEFHTNVAKTMCSVAGRSRAFTCRKGFHTNFTQIRTHMMVFFR